MPAIDVHDDFARPDGPVGGGWTDLADQQHMWTDVDGLLTSRPTPPSSGDPTPWWPTTPYRTAVGGQLRDLRVRPRILSAASVVDGVATFQPSATNMFVGPLDPETAYAAHFQVGHFLLYRQLGVSDDVEVGVTFACPDAMRAIQQVSPVAFVDPQAADPQLMGLLPICDVSLGELLYIQNAFRCPENQVFWPAYYRILGSDGALHSVVKPDNGRAPGYDPPPRAAFTSGAGVTHTMALRARAGNIAMYVDGVLSVGPFPVPAAFQGRDGWGIHVIAFQFDPSLGLQGADISPALDGLTFDHDYPALVSSWWATSFDGDWGDPFS